MKHLTQQRLAALAQGANLPATPDNVKALGGCVGEFKHSLMDLYSIPHHQSWDVPAQWQAAYKQACGRL